MTEQPDAISYRVAVKNDQFDILPLFREVASEIPIPDGPKGEVGMVAETHQCCRDGKSWVAVDGDGKVIGFALARRDLRAQDTAISLKYIGVSKNDRGRGVCSTLIEKLKSDGVPLTASVLHNNKSDMGKRFTTCGFTTIETDGQENRFRWDP